MSSFDFEKIRKVVSSGMAEQVSSKGERRKRQIIEAGISIFSKKGFESTNYDDLAKACKISRSLVHHHFADKNELLITTIRYTREHFQRWVVVGMGDSRDPHEILERYIQFTLSWAPNNKELGHLWLLYFYQCGVSPELKQLNTEFVDTGRHRIGQILLLGLQLKKFEFDFGEIEQICWQIQNMLMGCIISLETENRTIEQAQKITENTANQILSLVLP
jgi:AcrR family transcriptional regulator